MKKVLIICSMVGGLFLGSCSSNNESTATAPATDSTATVAADSTVATATDTVATDSAACPMTSTK